MCNKANIMVVDNAKLLKKKKRNLEIVSMSHSTLCSLQILKLYAWEPSFQTQVEDIRNKELIVMKKFAYLTSVSTFIFSCAPALVSDVTKLGSQKTAPNDTWTAVVSFSLTDSFLSGVTCLIRRVCRREPRQRAYCREGFHRYFPFQHPPIPPGHAATAHRRHGAGMARANPDSMSRRETYFR